MPRSRVLFTNGADQLSVFKHSIHLLFGLVINRGLIIHLSLNSESNNLNFKEFFLAFAIFSYLTARTTKAQFVARRINIV